MARFLADYHMTTFIRHACRAGLLGLAMGAMPALIHGAPAAAENAEFVIGADDVLHVVVWRNDALTRTVRVRPDGMITLPLINDIPAAGFTPTGLRRVITEALADVVDAPRVSVIVQEINSAKFTILGEVRKPGIYPLGPQMTMFDAVALAEGFSDFASPNQIVVLRRNDGEMSRVKFKYFDAVSGRVDATALRLKAGDTILVP